MTKTKTYKPDMRMRQAMERAAQHQPPLIPLASKVPPDYSAVRDQSVKGKA
ncbi:hypothetical protein MNJPNG_04920 [Cupriavidus oxalaticus]|uniref:hypothetical protein n=1 Tax=Cupriavidus oxalaticus TaxID=96344 RepID=UPI003F733F01